MSIISPPCVLSIAGTDPSGGAGIHADIKAISATGSYAAAVITALVAQNTQTVYSILDIPADFLKQQLISVFEDLDIKAIKIGMLHNADVINTVTDYLNKYNHIPVILDPVMIAKNGANLLQPEIINILKTKLLSSSFIITPNILEAEKLLDFHIKNNIDMELASKKLGEKYNTHILLKGGHNNNSANNTSSDVLYNKNTGNFTWYHSPRINTKNTHGTGCTLSSALASYIAQGFSLEKSIELAKNYLSRAILSAKDFTIGKGFGPVDHFYYLRDKNYVSENNNASFTST